MSAADHIPADPEKILTDFWRKPIPTDQFDWSASFDGDEPDDNGNMLVGYGATESAAIADLLEWSQVKYDAA